MKYALVLSLVFLATFSAAKAACSGCKETADLEETKKVVKQSLKAMAATEKGPFYTLEKIHSATSQITRGKKYFVEADLKDKNTEEVIPCYVQIYDQTFLHKVKVTINCGDKPQVVRNAYRRKVLQ